MSNASVIAIFTCQIAGGTMQSLQEVEAIAGCGLLGDRYASGVGSFNTGRVGKRQVTLINSIFFLNSGFDYSQSRRNIITAGVELMWLIGREFQIGNARLRGLKYCDPCDRPRKLAEAARSFEEEFSDRGGLVAEVLEGGLIAVGDLIISPPKGY